MSVWKGLFLIKSLIEFPNAPLQPNAEEALLCIHNFLDVLELIDDKRAIILSQETVIYGKKKEIFSQHENCRCIEEETCF